MVKKKSTFHDRRRKKQRIVFIILAAFLSVGLIGSSMVWMGGGYFSPPEENKAGMLAPQETVSSLEAKVKENPGDVQALVELARVYAGSERSKEALETYEKAVALKPDDSSLRLELAWTSFLSDDYDNAITNLEKEIKRRPENKEAYYLYGYVLAEGKKDYQHGIQQLEKFIELAKEGDEVVKARQTIEEWKQHLQTKG
jgi:cytochrome c-type biogenesis protein CcmH/NrfG